MLSQSNYMIVNKKIAKSLGLINSILVSNLCSLEEKYGNGFFFTQEEMAETCCVCLDTIKKGLSFLKKEGYIDIKKKGIPCKNYYYLTDYFEKYIKDLLIKDEIIKLDDNNSNKLVDISTNNEDDNNTNNINNTINNNNNKEDTNVSKKDCNDSNLVSEQVDELYDMYPTKCPKRNVSLGKSFKCKDKLKKLIKQYGYEMLKFTISKECEEKYGKSYMSNFSTFLNNLPDYGYVKSESNEASEVTDNKSNDININGVTYK